MTPALAEAARRQRQASDPATSAWVSANAGSGKTHVLAQRVIRLLLQGVQPSKLLCLTFTKAAAANMADKVFSQLARWTQMDDAALALDLAETGAGPVDLTLARRLFARAIETPGGLKIQTIHAFCERVLHLFPFEANVPAGFRPLDEREARELREAAHQSVFASEGLAEAIARVADLVSATGFGGLMAETSALGEALTVHGPPDAYAAKLAARLGLGPGEDEASITHEMLALGPQVWKAWAKALNTGSTNDHKIAAVFSGVAATPDSDAYLQAFFTQAMTPRKTLATKGTTERYPDIVEAIYQERERLTGLLEKRRAAAAVAASREVYRLSLACAKAYARAKALRSALDFDDLIVKTESLLARTDAAWVLYKLDRGVEHILVDEAQDTSRPQWKILAKLAEDFLSGRGAGPQGRSFFAVGDEKQSIFSFQGAQPHLFDDMRRYFSRRHERAERPFTDVRLTHSFRSSPRVLEAVDRVFAVESVWKGVSAGEAVAEPHAPIREALPGLIEIWPPLKAEPAPDPGDWQAPLDAQRLDHPAERLAERVAAVIAAWTAPGSPERITDKAGPRPISPGDILILVRQRGPFFEAITRALRRRRIPAAGADRLKLAQHIAVKDLCAAARAALSDDDDLALAAVLKSPLIGLTDEDLIRLAPARKGTLAAALGEEGGEAAARVALWRARAGWTPFAFFARLLGEDGGRAALVGRLGGEAADVIDEFLARALAHEREAPPSLAAFVAEIETAQAEIKRDMDQAAGQVRVMTVHASKGLEAPIVFLPDTAGAPTGKHDPKWLRLPAPHSGAAPLPVFAPRAAEDTGETGTARAAARLEASGEHRRLLYVAMTRAAQRLIVASYEGGKAVPEEAWINLIAPGLAPHLHEAPSWWSPEEPLLRLGEPPRGDEAATVAPLAAAASTPIWAESRAPHEVVYAPIAPSRRVAGVVGAERLRRIEEGRLAHSLLQILPDFAPERRAAAAAAYLNRRAPMLPADRRQALGARILGLLALPALAPLFGPGSRAEVAFATQEMRQGRIDRLARVGDEVWIADYKSGPVGARGEYQSQLAQYVEAVAGLYEGAKIRAFLIWIDVGILEELPETSLRALR